MSGLFRVCFFICVTESSFTVSYQMQRASSIVVLVCYVSRHDNEMVFTGYVWKSYARNTIINRVTDTFFDFALGEPKAAMTQAMYVSNNVLLS